MKKLLYILFHRSVFVCLALLAQFATLVIMVVVFSEYTESFYWCCIVISILAALAAGGGRHHPPPDAKADAGNLEKIRPCPTR